MRLSVLVWSFGSCGVTGSRPSASYAKAASGIRFQFFVENVLFVGGKLRSTVHGQFQKENKTFISENLERR